MDGGSFKSTTAVPEAIAPLLAPGMKEVLAAEAALSANDPPDAIRPPVHEAEAYWSVGAPEPVEIEDGTYTNAAGDAMALVILAAAWKQISYNFLFFLAGLQSIPQSLIEAAAIDGAGRTKRFWTIIFPLLSPTTFFLMVVNIVYAMFDTFGVIHATTAGGPAQATNILVYKVYRDGFIGNNLGSSAAQSVILMGIVIVLTVVQFRWIERRVNY